MTKKKKERKEKSILSTQNNLLHRYHYVSIDRSKDQFNWKNDTDLTIVKLIYELLSILLTSPIMESLIKK